MSQKICPKHLPHACLCFFFLYSSRDRSKVANFSGMAHIYLYIECTTRHFFNWVIDSFFENKNSFKICKAQIYNASFFFTDFPVKEKNKKEKLYNELSYIKHFLFHFFVRVSLCVKAKILALFIRPIPLLLNKSFCVCTGGRNDVSFFFSFPRRFSSSFRQHVTSISLGARAIQKKKKES